MKKPLLLLDIGNTHTHLGLANAQRVIRQDGMETRAWENPVRAHKIIRKFLGDGKPVGVALCSVVPSVTSAVLPYLQRHWDLEAVVLTDKTATGIGINYPSPETIGPDRLANSIAAKHHYGSPVVVVDFGTAVTFDVVDRKGDYVGGIIAPGLSVMTDYLHEKTALLPRIRIRDEKAIIGRNTEQAMLIGAVQGYRGLVRELILQLRKKMGVRKLPVLATGGYAALMAKGLPEITGVNPLLTLEGLRLMWHTKNGAGRAQNSRRLHRKTPAS
jgi:type III pantothenate kinase